jgi:hypothetical protein
MPTEFNLPKEFTQTQTQSTPPHNQDGGEQILTKEEKEERDRHLWDMDRGEPGSNGQEELEDRYASTYGDH